MSTIAYEPSSTYVNTNLPYVIQTVSSFTLDDGDGDPFNNSTVNYTYNGGLFDRVFREFRGFAHVTSIDPVGTTTETWFDQGDDYKKMLTLQTIRDAAGYNFSRVAHTYSNAETYPGVKFVYIYQTTEGAFNAYGTVLMAGITFTYDTTYGNLIQKSYIGNFFLAGDEKDEYFEYQNDTTKETLIYS